MFTGRELSGWALAAFGLGLWAATMALNLPESNRTLPIILIATVCVFVGLPIALLPKRKSKQVEMTTDQVGRPTPVVPGSYGIPIDGGPSEAEWASLDQPKKQ